MPDLRQLRAFLAVAEERNFTRAAERLHLAQQAVSKTVANLENELGVELLERTSREVRLTPAGAVLLESGREALASAEAAFARAREIGRGLAGTVRVGATPAVGRGVLRELVQVLREEREDLAVSVSEVRPGDVPRVLQDRDVDLVLARTLRDSRLLDSAALRPTPAILAMPVEHALAGAATVGLADLDGERLLTWSPRGTPYTDLLVDRLAAAGARVTAVESRVTGTEDLSELAELGAIGLVPVGWGPTAGVVQVALREEVTLPLLAVWRAGVPPAAVERLRRRMSTTFLAPSPG